MRTNSFNIFLNIRLTSLLHSQRVCFLCYYAIDSDCLVIYLFLF